MPIDLCRLLPTVIVLLVFGVLAGYSHLVSSANQCSCWCLPVYGNVLPLANATPMDDVRAVPIRMHLNSNAELPSTVLTAGNISLRL